MTTFTTKESGLYLWVENTILQTYPAKRPYFDMEEVCKSLPDNFAAAFGFNRNYEQEAALNVPALSYFDEAKEELTDFIRVVGFCVEKINTSGEVRPEITSEDLSSQLHMQPLAIRKMGLLLQSEFDITDGSGFDKEWWRCTLKRGKTGVRRFEGVETIEQYLGKRTALTRYYSGNAAVQPAQSEPANVVPALSMGIISNQYHTLQGDQYNMSGNSRQVNSFLEKVEIFFCYAREDEELRQGLEKQLRALRRQGLINMWHDRDISAGTEWERDIHKHLNAAQIILLLVSPDFMGSDYCYGIEMKRAMERHEQGEAQVIPIILRPVYWQGAPFGKLQALPTDGRPVTSSKWHNLDEAFFDAAEGIRKAVEKLISKHPLPASMPKMLVEVPIVEPVGEPDPITFKHRSQEDDYRNWVAKHRDDGLIVVRDGSKWRVHHAYCPHITGPIDKGQNLMTYPKICSTTLSKLRSEAEKFNSKIMTNCSCQQ